MSNQFVYSLAPEKLWQAINPMTFFQNGAQFGMVNISIGATAHPETEEEILESVGSYGRQLGQLGDVVDILLRHVALSDLDKAEQRAITKFKGQLAAIEEIKLRHQAER